MDGTTKEAPQVRLFVDMDGTIAAIHEEPNWWERCKEEPSFFEKLEPFSNLITAIFCVKFFYKDIVEIHTLSAVDDATMGKVSKNHWIDENLPFVKGEDRIYSKMGQRKSTAIQDGKLLRTDVLLDDYTKNCMEWTEDGGTAVKIRNNINCREGKWKGDVIYNQDSFSQIAKKLDDLIKKLIKEDAA